MDFSEEVFNISDDEGFNHVALKIFRYQYGFNKIYREFTGSLGRSATGIKNYRQIPFMPVEFFKNHTILTGDDHPSKIFLSSGTTGMVQSRHNVTDLGIYEESLLRGFELFYGPPADYLFLGRSEEHTSEL